jgi:serine/threonine protein kinase
METMRMIVGADGRPRVRAASAPGFHFCGRQVMDSLDSENSRGSSSSAAVSTSPFRELSPGDVLDGRFRILDVINRGGMAQIYEALDLQTGQPVALKVPFLQFEADPSFHSRFQREENIGLTLDHPGVLKLIPVGPEKGRPYIGMELLKGRTLAARLRQSSPLPESEAARIASRICDGLDYLHKKGVVHRDLKPQNIMLCDDGSIRIMDFGIAKSKDSRRLTFGGFSATMGTPDYIAPEQVQGKRGDARSDIYALGAMLYEMTTGLTPFDGDNPYVVMNARVSGDPEAPRTCNPLLSPQMEEIILHALERNPSRRFASAAAMKAELNNFGGVLLTERSKRLRPPQLWKARLPLLPKIAGLLLAQFVMFVLLWWWFSHRTHPGVRIAAPPPAASDTAR